jgi:hypothetical protein
LKAYRSDDVKAISLSEFYNRRRRFDTADLKHAKELLIELSD